MFYIIKQGEVGRALCASRTSGWVCFTFPREDGDLHAQPSVTLQGEFCIIDADEISAYKEAYFKVFPEATEYPSMEGHEFMAVVFRPRGDGFAFLGFADIDSFDPEILLGACVHPNLQVPL
jgi:hypothetical protein